MANINSSAALLDECVDVALNLGIMRAQEQDTTEQAEELGRAVDAYVASLWYMPEDERPTARQVSIVMVRNAYLAYLHEMGLLPLEQLPDAFKILEALYPNK